MPAADAPFRPLRIRAEMYQRMLEAGVFDGAPAVELLDGELIQMSPQGTEHATLSELLADLARSAFGIDWVVCSDKPMFCGGYDLPEPDVFVVPGPRRRYLTRHPRANESVLVVEVAKTSQAVDQAKAAVYAAAGAPVYWMLDLLGRTLTVLENPAEGRYGSIRILDESESATFPGTVVTVPFRDLLP